MEEASVRPFFPLNPSSFFLLLCVQVVCERQETGGKQSEPVPLQGMFEKDIQALMVLN